MSLPASPVVLASPHGVSRESPWTVWVVSAALAVTAFATFSRCLFAEFITFDDPFYVVDNRNIHGGLTWDGLAWAWTTYYAANWHPLVWMSLMLDRSLFGAEPWGYHLTNVLLHVVNTVVLFLAVRELTGETWRPALVALLFAIHPQRVESVAWVTERKDVLSGLFWMLSLWGYAYWARRDASWAWWAAVVSLAVGLTAKQMLVTLPCVLILLDLWPLGRWSGRLWGAAARGTPREGDSLAAPRLGNRSLAALVGEKWPMFAVVVAGCVLVIQAQSAAGVVASLSGVPLAERLRNALTAYGLYLGLAVYPIPLSIFYPYHTADFGWGGAVGVAVLLVAGVGLAVWNRRRWPAGLVGLLWYLGTMAPVIGLVQVGQQALADRYTYIPMIGIGLSVAWLVPAVPVRAGERRVHPGWLGAAAACAVLIGITVWQTGFWLNSDRLFARSLEVTTNNHVAHFLYAERLRKRGDMSAALEHFRRTTEIDQMGTEGANAWVSIGRDFEHRGRAAEAEVCYRKALAQSPRLAAGLEGLASLEVRKWFQRKGKPDELAEPQAMLEEAVRKEPWFYVGHYSLALVYMLRGDLDRSEQSAAMAVELNPDFREAQGLVTELRQRPGRSGR
jgi:hypothetical protein